MKQKLFFSSRAAFFLLLFLMNSQFIIAQNYVVIGSGTAVNTASQFPCPYGNTNWGDKNQFFIRASELLSFGLTSGSMVNSLGFYVTATNSVDPLIGWNVKVYTTTNTNPLSTGWQSTGLVAYSNPTTLVVDTGWNQTSLSHPFIWNGTDNLVIETCFNNDAPSANASVQRTTGMTGSTYSRYLKGNLNSICGDLTSSSTSTTQNRSNIRFGYATSSCSGVPTPGAAFTNNANPCVNETIELGINGTSFANGITVQWQSSSSSSGPWTAISGATNMGYFFAASGTAYYRAVVSCASNSATSNSVLVTVNPYLAGGTYTINSALPTSGSNFHSFSDFGTAIQYAISGPVIVNVTAGTYNEKLYLNEICGVSSTNTITINGNGATLNYVSSNTNNRGIITLDGTDYVTINNLNLKGYSTSATNYAWGVFITNNADNDTISNCTITLDSNATTSNYAGIVTSGSFTNPLFTPSECDYVSLTNNTVNGGLYGITIVGDTAGNQLVGWNVTSNTIRNSGNYGIYGWGTTSMVVSKNDISRTGRTNMLDFSALYFINGHTGLKIQKNKIHDISTGNLNATFDFYGVYLLNSPGQTGTLSTKNEVSNNILYNLNGLGNHWYFYNTGSGYTGYYNNSLATNRYATAATGTTYGYYHDITNNDPYIYFSNNNISITRNTANTKAIYYVWHGATKLIANYNNLFVNGDGFNYIGFYTCCFYNSIFNWMNISSKDFNSASCNPYFLSPTSGNLKPQSTYMDNTGSNEGITTDILGTARTTTPDIGAYEYTVSTCSGAPTAGSAVADLANACPGGNVLLTVDNASMGTGISILWQSKPSVSGSWSTISGSNPINYYSYYNATMPSVSTDYRAMITCGSNTVYSNSITVGLQPWYMCYCSPYTGDSLHASNNYSNILTNVNITGTTLNNTTVNGYYAAGYSRHNPSISSNSAYLSKLNPYTINVSFGGPNYLAGVWVDYDKNQVFDTSEYFVLTTTGNSATGSFTIPATSTVGLTGMRVRAYFAAVGPNTDACVKNTAQETEDYAIQVWYALAIKVEDINAFNSGSKNKIYWNTQTEDFGDYFELERSFDGINFEKITTIQSRGFGSDYTYWDENPANGMNYYRLKMVALNGDISYTKVVSAIVKSSNAFEVKMYPNPTTKLLNVSVTTENILNASVSICDITGKLLRKISISDNNSQVDIADLNPGIYFFQYNDDLHKKTVKVIKQ